MEAILIKAAQMILILSVIVILHEGGHYAAAKLFKTKVERFFLFFDVKFALFKKQIGETVYGIGWLPLGGYVKIAGMVDESMDTEQLKKPAQPWEFRSKPAWQRLIIMLAGIIVNLLLAMIIFGVMSYTNGEQFVNVNKLDKGIVVDSAQAAMGLEKGDIPIGVNGVNYIKLKDISKRALIDGGELNVKRGNKTVNLPINEDALVSMLEQKGSFFTPNVTISADSVAGVAAAAGLKKGDKLIALNNEPIQGWRGVVNTIASNANQTITFTVNREGETKNIAVKVPAEAKIGLGPSFDVDAIVDTNTFGLAESLRRGITMTFSTITDQVQSFGVLWRLKGKATKYVSGPLGIAKELPAKWDWTFFWSFTALLSAWLAFVNILPIPGLDGGHAMFTIYEMVTGHKPGDKFMEVMQIIGFVFLMALMVFIFGNDIVNLIYN